MLFERSIVVRDNFEAFHSWPSCPHEEVSFLRFLHRHIFYVEVRLFVGHADRDLEFFIVKKDLNLILSEFRGKQFPGKSCEMFCENILNSLRDRGYSTIYYASVFEDGENGAILEDYEKRKY